MDWFWIGIAVFSAGVIVRVIFKVRYYRDYKNNAHTDRQRDEIRSKYRPLIFIGLGLEVLGLVFSAVSIWLQS